MWMIGNLISLMGGSMNSPTTNSQNGGWSGRVTVAHEMHPHDTASSGGWTTG
jgi:hypothetical protein